MRYAVLSFAIALGLAGSNVSLGQSPAPLIRVIAKHVGMPEFETATYKYQCPAGHIPVAYSFTPRMPYEMYLENDRSLIDKNGTKVSRNSLSSLGQLDGGGLSVSLYNIDCHLKEWEAFVSCLSSSASTDNTLTMTKASLSVAAKSVGVVTSFCPADSPVALSGFSNADGTMLQDTASAPVWGTSGSLVALADVADGTMGPPAGWQAKVLNNNSTSLQVDSIAICGNAPSLQTYIYSSTVPPSAAFGSKALFSVFGPVPDGWTAVGSGFDGTQYSQFLGQDIWMQDGAVINMLLWFPNVGGYDSGPNEIRALMASAAGNAPNATSPRAVMAVLALPKSAPAPLQTTVVEFYHAVLDHYFITAIPKEISDLDTGVHPGWTRTGQTFKSYGIGSSGRTGRRPVCRAYGLPSAGIDSHFYSASPDECSATMVNFGDAWGRPGSWGLEASEVFQMDLPDPITGACPADGVPIYRVFNQRKDANHRYTSNMTIRDQMVAKGGVAEGYGPDAVALCGLP